MKTSLKMIGSRIQEVRKSLGLTQGAFGELLGVSAPTISKYESGDTDPGSINLAKIAELGKVNAGWLLLDKVTIKVTPGTNDSHVGETQAPYSPSRKIENTPLMQNLIQWVEEGCEEHGITIKPAAKAKLLIRLYEIFAKENPEVQKEEVVRYLRLVA